MGSLDLTAVPDNVKSLSAIDPATIQAYRETEYRIIGANPVVMRVGVMCAELAVLHDNHHARCSAFITACNPLGEVVGDTVNAERQEALAEELACRGLSTLPGIGQHPRGEDWPGEPSYWVPGLGRDAAQLLGRQFEQNAIIWVGADAVPELILLR